MVCQVRQIASFFERFEPSDKIRSGSIQGGPTFLVNSQYLEHRLRVALERGDVIQGERERVIEFVSHSGGESPDGGEFFRTDELGLSLLQPFIGLPKLLVG